MDAAAIVENAGNSGRERRLGKGCEHVQTWSGVFHNRFEREKTLRVSHDSRPQAPPARLWVWLVPRCIAGAR